MKIKDHYWEEINNGYYDMNSRTYPRTMKEAFGPYTSDMIEDHSDAIEDAVGIAVGFIVFVFVLIFICAGLLK